MTAWRELSDEQLAELETECKARIDALNAQGVGVDFSAHYIRVMLEQLLGERGVARAREIHFLFVCDQLNLAEPQVRELRAREVLGLGPMGHANGGRARG